ncbi:MAG: transposase [Patiriisocius sp.]|jgi:transposase
MVGILFKRWGSEGVSAHSIYTWVNAVKPNNSARHDEELLAGKSEILKLKSKLRRTEEV